MSSDTGVHLFVAVNLIGHSSEETTAVLDHALDHVALLLHGPLELAVLFQPFLFSQLTAQVRIFVLGIVAPLAAVGSAAGSARLKRV